MKKNFILLLVSVVYLMTSCEFVNLNRPDVIPADENKLNDEEILALAYSADYFYPEGFYTENNEGAVYYENTISIRSDDNYKYIELCTDDVSKALEWSELSNTYSSTRREIISQRETGKFYEFTRKGIEHQDILLSRVHKSDYFQPTLDKLNKTEEIGIYQGELSTENVRELIEYLFVNYCTATSYSKVLSTTMQETDEYYRYTIRSLTIVYGDWGVHDYIHVNDHKFKLDKSNRILTQENSEVKVIQGSYNDSFRH